MKRIGLSILVFLIVSLLAGLALLTRAVPRFEQLKSSYASRDRAVLDRNGLLVDEIHRDPKYHRFNWVEFSETPRFLQTALLADDLNIAAMVGGGGSYWRTKFIEWTWRKSELAEVFLNHSVFRKELQGFAAASFGLFDKPPAELSRSEAAVILALAESDDPSRVTERACDWLNRMQAPQECGLLSQDHLMQIEKSYRIVPFLKMAPQFTEEFAAAEGLARQNLVRSTLDRELQWSIIQALARAGIHHGVAVVLENESGNLLAYVNTEADPGDTGAHAAASVLQPFLYARAIDERVITAGSMLPNSALALARDGERLRRREKISAREAVNAHMSIPALTTMQLLGPDHFARTLMQLGFSDFEKTETFGPSLALGGVDVRGLEVANAYRALANGGLWTPLRVSPDQLSELAPRKVFSREAAFVAADMLADAEGRVSFANRNWSAGFSGRYTVVIWASQENLAPSVWRVVMERLHALDPAVRPPAPETLVRGAARGTDGRWRGEWYLEGTEPGALDGAAVASRISYPQNHSTIELGKSERFLIKVVGPRADQNLYLNGERLGRAQSYLKWEARSGRFTLELRDSQGQVVDRVRFEVRGRSFAQVR